MKKSIRTKQSAEWKQKPGITVGVDLGDRFSYYCVLNAEGDVVEQGRIATKEAALRQHFAGEARQRIALECGTHSPWASRLLSQLGHQVIVANARKVRAISQNESKNDRHDAEMLARLAYSDPHLLRPIQHRSVERQRDLNLLRARDTLVRARTMLVNALRGLVKSAGARLPQCSTASFAVRARATLPAELQAAAKPLLEQIAALSGQIAGLDRQIEKLVGGALSGDQSSAHRARSGADRGGGLCVDPGFAGCGEPQPLRRCLLGAASPAEPIGR